MRALQFTKLEFKLFQFFCKIDALYPSKMGILLNLLVSGGQDSMCLLNAVSTILNSKRFQPNNQFTVVVTHFNHKKRGWESDEDAFLVMETCLKLGIECVYFEIPNNTENQNFQDFARIQRRQISKAVCQKLCNELHSSQYFILTAHHARDHVESVLLHMIRGSGIVGLQGFYAENDPYFLKPFAEIGFNDIQTYARHKKIIYRTDSSNNTDDYDRNVLRHHILPQFAQLNSSYEKNILRCSKQLREISDKLNVHANQPLQRDESNKTEQQPFVFSPETTSSELYFYLKKHLNHENSNISENSVLNIFKEVHALQKNPICFTKTIPLKNDKKLTIYKPAGVKNKILGCVEM